MNLIGLLGFWLLPTAPPRLLPDGSFVDTVVRFHTWGSWGDGAVASATNQYTAFPSLHVGWSVWVALAVCSLASNRIVRAATITYPVLTSLVVIGKANHYVIDVVAGGVTCLLGLATVTLLTAAVPHARRPHMIGDGAGHRLEPRGRGDWRSRRPALILILITVLSLALGAAATAVLSRRASGRRRPGWGTEGMRLDGPHRSTGSVAPGELTPIPVGSAEPVLSLPGGRPHRLVVL